MALIYAAVVNYEVNSSKNDAMMSQWKKKQRKNNGIFYANEKLA